MQPLHLAASASSPDSCCLRLALSLPPRPRRTTRRTRGSPADHFNSAQPTTWSYTLSANGGVFSEACRRCRGRWTLGSASNRWIRHGGWTKMVADVDSGQDTGRGPLVASALDAVSDHGRARLRADGDLLRDRETASCCSILWSPIPMQRHFSRAAAAYAFLIFTAALMPPVRPAAADEIIPARPTPRWWKGNLHTHTFWSDGDDFPEMVAEWYRTHDYNFLALFRPQRAGPRHAVDEKERHRQAGRPGGGRQLPGPLRT